MQPVLAEHHDISRPKLCLFASRDITFGEELTCAVAAAVAAAARAACQVADSRRPVGSFDYGLDFVRSLLGPCFCRTMLCHKPA